MKGFLSVFWLGLLTQGVMAELPAFVQKATDARAFGEGIWHITPRRIVWKSEAGLEGVGNLLKAGPGQAVLGRPNPVCVLKSGGSVVLDFGVELQGGIEIFTGIQPDQVPVPVRVRFGESVSEVMAAVGEKGATNDHSIREEIVNLPWLGKRRIVGVGGHNVSYISPPLLNDFPTREIVSRIIGGDALDGEKSMVFFIQEDGVV